MNQIVELLIPLGSFAMVFGIVYVGVTANHRKEIAMIEAGMNPNKKDRSNHSKLRKGLLLLLVPIGIFVGNWVGRNTGENNLGITAILFGFLFGGIALMVSYIVDKKQKNNLLEN